MSDSRVARNAPEETGRWLEHTHVNGVVFVTYKAMAGDPARFELLSRLWNVWSVLSWCRSGGITKVHC